jgi:hypothetical protein
MKTVLQDDRTPEQKKTHTRAIVATDRFMSGWGGASKGLSKCAWAYDPNTQDAAALLAWVEARREMKYVNFATLAKYRPGPRCEHFHIYVAGDNHPAFNK